MSEEVRRDFLDALARLKRGKPTSKELLQRDTVKININTVAIEADRSRTLIGFDGCDYDDVRDIIKAEMDKTSSEDGDQIASSGSLQSIITRLRDEKKLLKLERSQLASQLGAALNKIASLEKFEGRRRHDSKRASGRPTVNENPGTME